MRETLLQAIHRALGDGESADDAMAVYGDWLQSQGDPRGEFIALDIQVAGFPDDRPAPTALRARLERLRVRFESELLEDPGVTYTWRCGFVHALKVDDQKAALSPETILPLFESESVQFLQGMEFQLPFALSERPTPLVQRSLAALRQLRHLRAVSIAGAMLDSGDCSNLAALHGLVELQLLRSDIDHEGWLEPLLVRQPGRPRRIGWYQNAA